jgi:hypothetical protein
MKQLLVLLSIAAMLGLSGCGARQAVLGGEGYFFRTYDVIALPGEPVDLRAKLEAGDLLSDQPGRVVRFRRDG